MSVNDRNEFNEENWVKTSVIKLHRLLCFHKELINREEALAKFCGFDIWVDDENGYTVHAGKFDFYLEGSNPKTGFHGSEPITCRDLVDILFGYNNPQKDRSVVQNFVEKFFSISSCAPAQWLPGIDNILQTPVCEEEYKSIEEIIEANEKKTALGWLDKVREFSNSRFYYRPIAESYIEKAQEIYPQIDASEAWGIIENKNKH